MSEELKDKMYQKLSLYSSELEDRIEDLEKLNTTITMENERLINEMKKLEKDNQTLMNSIVTEAHTKETKEIERLKERIEDLNTINEEHQILNGMIRKELQQKENILKEAREYIKSYMPNYDFDKTNLIKLLEILDKENNDNV